MHVCICKRVKSVGKNRHDKIISNASFSYSNFTFLEIYVCWIESQIKVAVFVLLNISSIKINSLIVTVTDSKFQS